MPEIYLTEDLLCRFEEALRSVGAKILGHLAPGVSDAEIDAALRPHDIDLPEEARVWWRWRNGTVPSEQSRWMPLVPGRAVRSVEHAALYYEMTGSSWQDYGLTKVLEPFSEQPILLLDCTVAREEPVPVHMFGDYTDDVPTTLPSFGAIIAAWSSYIERGWWVTVPDGSWDYQRFHATLPEAGESMIL